jgi:2-methylcitrate dehydratase
MARVILKKNTNQALKLAEFARDFMKDGNPSFEVLQRAKLFHTDSTISAITALALGTHIPNMLRNEALSYVRQRKRLSESKGMIQCFGSKILTFDYKAICANVCAAREWDEIGYSIGIGGKSFLRQQDELGSSHLYSIVMSAAQQTDGISGRDCLKAMVLLEEIRGRLAQSFSLKDYNIDQSVNSAIATIVVYGTLIRASPVQIESGIGTFLAHYVPFFSREDNDEMNDYHKSSTILSLETAIMSLKRARAGFIGPMDIFRNPDCIFRHFQKSEISESPFDFDLGLSGDDFYIMDMYFKLGIYQAECSTVIQALMNAYFLNGLVDHLPLENIKKIKVLTSKDALPEMIRNCENRSSSRRSAVQSVSYILATLIRKGQQSKKLFSMVSNENDLWKNIILLPSDYTAKSISNPATKEIENLLEFAYGGPEYDVLNEGVAPPVSVTIVSNDDREFRSEIVSNSTGNSKTSSINLNDILQAKFTGMAKLALLEKHVPALLKKLNNIEHTNPANLKDIYDCDIKFSENFFDND